MLVGMPLLRVFDRMGCGGILLDTEGHVVGTNLTARLILQSLFGLTDEAATTLNHSGREVIKKQLRLGQTRIQLDSDNWIRIDRDTQRPIIMNAVPMPGLGAGNIHTALLLIDLDGLPIPTSKSLENVFGLTHAEARLALLLVEGYTVTEIADKLGLSILTLRTQLKKIFSKTQTTRQSELVMLISRLASLA